MSRQTAPSTQVYQVSSRRSLLDFARAFQLTRLGTTAVFHEGLKGWSCCKRRETSFDDFLNIPGCATGTHSSEAPVAAPKPVVPAAAAPSTTNAEGKEVYGAAAPAPLPPAPSPAPAPALADGAKPVSTAYVEEQVSSGVLAA